MTFISKVIKYLIEMKKNICYILTESRVKKMAKENNKGIFEAKDLACYIKKQYSIFTNDTKTITPIKMQKALYFCFAFWSGFVNKGKLESQILEGQNNLLFADKIEAWSYGPVVPNVYFDEKESILFKNKLKEEEAIKKVEAEFETNQFLGETINAILEDVFEISDFKLVSISHMDKSWQNHFDENQKKHNEEIPKEEIINEYTTKKYS